ncbi:MAG: hypothetical protein ABJF10_21330, partial [Chthoniobacter sp.]|uniref:hypothetical protein n=1 Tax=Chthoniobacter sp. TaxID=2510640 RepID=UPI0032A6B552
TMDSRVQELSANGRDIHDVLVDVGKPTLADAFLKQVTEEAEWRRYRASRKAKLNQLGVFALIASPCVGMCATLMAKAFLPSLATMIGAAAAVVCFLWVCSRLPNNADFR